MKNHFLLFALCALSLQVADAKPKARNIKRIAPITLEVEQGQAPTLPYQVWVTYTDGSHEWRQTRWDNSQKQTEQQQADCPSGSTYTVSGFITGSNATDNGYPIEAKVTVTNKEKTGGQAKPHVVAEPLPLNQVKLIGKNRLTSNASMDVRALLALDISQQL